MRHSFRPGMSKTGPCLICGYDGVSHTDTAVCEACGLNGDCDLWPDDRNPRKMLLCAECYMRESKLATVVRVKSAEPVVDSVTSVFQVNTPGDYFNSNIPAVVDIQKAIAADDTIPDGTKKYEEGKRVKAHLQHLAKVLFELDTEKARVGNEQRDTRVYLNHLMKDLSAEKQHELGLADINYKQQTPKKTKQPKAPTVKSFDKVKLKEVAAQFGIEEHILQTIVTARKVSVEEAAKIAIAIQSKHSS
jgi:hypothetical protein